MESILTSTKKVLGITEECEAFDPDIIMHINSVLAILRQMGVGPKEGCRIYGKEETWDEITENSLLLEDIKSYMYMKVKMMFDPAGSSGTVNEAMNRLATELEWRITLTMEESV